MNLHWATAVRQFVLGPPDPALTRICVHPDASCPAPRTARLQRQGDIAHHQLWAGRLNVGLDRRCKSQGVAVPHSRSWLLHARRLPREGFGSIPRCSQWKGTQLKASIVPNYRHMHMPWCPRKTAVHPTLDSCVLCAPAIPAIVSGTSPGTSGHFLLRLLVPAGFRIEPSAASGDRPLIQQIGAPCTLIRGSGSFSPPACGPFPPHVGHPLRLPVFALLVRAILPAPLRASPASTPRLRRDVVDEDSGRISRRPRGAAYTANNPMGGYLAAGALPQVSGCIPSPPPPLVAAFALLLGS
ncbi:hypothetical protein B0H19DRAFT_1263600 [Mycena capillaripes]|nr:hypothetical protein B0H19DRAFT_1263600 [Mycena capillaripes]